MVGRCQGWNCNPSGVGTSALGSRSQRSAHTSPTRSTASNRKIDCDRRSRYVLTKKPEKIVCVGGRSGRFRYPLSKPLSMLREGGLADGAEQKRLFESASGCAPESG